MATINDGYTFVISDSGHDWAMYVRGARYEHMEDAVRETASGGMKLRRSEAEVVLNVLRYLEPAPTVQIENYRD